MTPCACTAQTQLKEAEKKKAEDRQARELEFQKRGLAEAREALPQALGGEAARDALVVSCRKHYKEGSGGQKLTKWGIIY